MIPILLVVVLILIALAHALWGLRIWWPFGDEARLARSVVGHVGITRMPPSWACYGVSAVLIGAAIWVAIMKGWIALKWLTDKTLRLGGFALAAVFILRGIAGYTPFWISAMAEEPFRSLDRRYFSPLCLVLGVGLLAVALS